MEFILDVGSHSLKLYRREESTQLTKTVTWEPINEYSEGVSTSEVELILQKVREDFPYVAVKAFGTGLMRQIPELASKVHSCCREYGAEFDVISQETEAELIRKAVSVDGTLPDTAVVNVGGRSIQVVLPSSEIRLLSFGIVDLNEKFNLTDSPGSRDIPGCQDFLSSQLPHDIGEFVYTGGEATYLQHFEVPMAGGYCDRDVFLRFAEELARRTIDDLMRNSPFDPKWMKGAIASNCIVASLLEYSRVERFWPSEINIGHGVVEYFS